MLSVRQITPQLSRQLRQCSALNGASSWTRAWYFGLGWSLFSEWEGLISTQRGGILITPLPGTPMAKPDPKQAALRAHGALHPRPVEVADELFEKGDFFDARDLVQVKYEMLRRVRVDRRSVTRASTDFGFSRPSYYQAKDAFEREGIPGLIPKKRGPKAAHKLTGEVVDYLEQALEEDSSLSSRTLTERLAKRFGIRVHPRSVDRALARRRESRRRKKGLQ